MQSESLLSYATNFVVVSSWESFKKELFPESPWQVYSFSVHLYAKKKFLWDEIKILLSKIEFSNRNMLFGHRKYIFTRVPEGLSVILLNWTQSAIIYTQVSCLWLERKISCLHCHFCFLNFSRKLKTLNLFRHTKHLPLLIFAVCK